MASSATPSELMTLSTITSVTVFEKGAQIFRQAEVAIGKGVTKVIFENLPSTLKRDTLQVALRSASKKQEELLDGILLKGISMESKAVANGEFEKETNDRQAALKRIEAIEVSILQLADSNALADRKKQFIDSSFAKATSTSTNQEKESPHAFDVAYWKKMVNSTVKSGEGTLVTRRANQLKLAVLKEERSQLQSRLIGHIPQRKKTQEFVAVLLDAAEGVDNLVLQISYLMDEAMWKPNYDVRVTNSSNDGVDKATVADTTSGESSINLTYNGSIEQWGPESWESISLDLSTAKPSMSGQQPTLAPWHMGLSKLPDTRPHLSTTPAGSSCQAAVVTQTAISQSFSVQGKQSIANDRKVCRVTLVQIPLKATFDYVAVPKEQEVAYARAKVENTSEYFLIPGVSSIFLNDQYIANSTIPKVCPKEKFDVDVGRDEGVLIERKQLKKQTSEESSLLYGKKTTIVYKYQLKVTNKKSGPISVQLQDAVPRSWQGSIEVKHELPVMPEEYSADLYRDRQDILHCVLRPQPNTSETIIVQYKVTYPTGSVVIGL